MSTTYKPSLAEVRELAQAGNLIAVYRELPADLETPVSVYLKLRGRDEDRGGLSFLLESVEKGEQLGRYSFIGVHPPMTVVSHGTDVTIGGAGGTVLETQEGDPLDVVKQLMAGRVPVDQPELPRFNGGVVGYFGYDLVRFMERLPETASHDLDVPDMMLFFCDNLVVFDHVRHKLTVIANMRARSDDDLDLRAAYADAVARIDQIIADLEQPLAPPKLKPVRPGGPWQSNFAQSEHEANVNVAKEHIKAGDIFQVVLSQRLSRETEADPFTIYRALRMLNPSPYMYFLDFSGIAGVTGEPIRIIGSSPEMHVRLEDGTAYLHPIAGTRWRGATAEEDAVLAEDLNRLCAVPGIGRWTAEIYAMFSLGRADVFAPNDLALQEAVRVLFDLPERPREKPLRTMAEAWSPWRTVAAGLLWHYYHHIKSREGIV